jgi:hypothetical protein
MPVPADVAATVKGILKGLDSMAQGEWIPADAAFEKLRKKCNIQRTKRSQNDDEERPRGKGP